MTWLSQKSALLRRFSWLFDSSLKGLPYPILLTITSTRPNLLNAVAKAV